MNIVHIITNLQRGGAEGALYRLATSSSTGSVMVVSLMSEGIYGPRLREAGVEVVALGLSSPVSTLRGFFQLRKLLKRRRPDLIQTWMYHADLLGGLAALGLSIPICWGIRNGGEAMRRKWTSRVVVRLCAALSKTIPDRIISCSRRAVAEHRAAGYRSTFEVVPNGVDIAKWQSPGVVLDVPSPVRDSTLYVFAHAARAHPQKDHATLAKAFSIAHAKDPSLRLLLCGDGLSVGEASFDCLPFSPAAKGSVRALGPRDDLPVLWREANAFVLSSIVEGFPNVVAEAMAAGLPCVVTDVGDAAYIVGDTGRVVSPSDATSLAQAMLELRNLPSEEHVRLANAARTRIEENFTQDRTAHAFNEIWRTVIAESGGPSGGQAVTRPASGGGDAVVVVEERQL